MIVVASRQYLGSGYQSTGEAWLPPRPLLGPGKPGGSPRTSEPLTRAA